MNEVEKLVARYKAKIAACKKMLDTCPDIADVMFLKTEIASHEEAIKAIESLRPLIRTEVEEMNELYGKLGSICLKLDKLEKQEQEYTQEYLRCQTSSTNEWLRNRIENTREWRAVYASKKDEVINQIRSLEGGAL